MEPLVGSSTVTQIAILVRDLDAASEAFATLLGVARPESFWLDGHDKAQTEYRGEPSEGRARLAFFRIGEHLQLELIEPDDEPSIWRDDLERHGEGLHHIAFEVQEMQKQRERLDAAGMNLIQRGEYEGGRYAYFDARGPLKLVVELLEND